MKPEAAMKTCTPKPGQLEEHTAKDADNNSPNTVSKYSVDELELSPSVFCKPDAHIQKLE